MDQKAMELFFKVLPHMDQIKLIASGLQKAIKGDVVPLMNFLQNLSPEKREEIMKLVVSMASKLGSPDILKLIT